MIFNKIKEFINNLFSSKKTNASGKLTTTTCPKKEPKESELPTPTRTPISTSIDKIETKNKPTSIIDKMPSPTPILNKNNKDSTPIRPTKKKSVKKKSAKKRRKK